MSYSMHIAKKLYNELQHTNKYQARIYDDTKVFAQLYVSPMTDATTPSPLDIAMTCDTNNNTWCITITNAPRLPTEKIKEVISTECSWLTLYTYVCEYRLLWSVPYLVFTIGLTRDICSHFIERVTSMDHMLRRLFNLPDNDSTD